MKYLNKKKYLITSYRKLNYPDGAELLFVDEYLYNLYNKKEKDPFKCSYINSFQKVIKTINLNNSILNKKLKIYRDKISILLNLYHKKNYSTKYWGLVIDIFLINLIQSIITEIKLLKKIKINSFSPHNEIVEEKIIYNLFDFNIYRPTNNFKKLLSTIILQEIGSKKIHLRYKKFNKTKIVEQTSYNIDKKKIHVSFLNSFIKLYINFFKPVVIANGYFGIKNIIKIFLMSFGKILIIPGKFLFNKSYIDYHFDEKFRQNIKIPEKDLIDKVFNKIIGKLLPVSYLENFSVIQKNIYKISNSIQKIGTASLHYNCEYFAILAAEIINRGGKFLTFQHGGLLSKTIKPSLEYFDQKYAYQNYNFDNKKGLGQHFFNYEKIAFDEIKKRNSILILNTEISFDRTTDCHQDFNHPYLDPSQIFYKKLDETTKKKTLIKLFPQKDSFKVKKIWVQKFGKNTNFIPFFLNARRNNFFNAKLVILNDINTPLYELIFSGLPFILVVNFTKRPDLKEAIKKKLINLKKINILFDDPTKAAKFVNSLIKNNYIEKWWEKTYKTNIFLDLKNHIIVEKKNYLSMIIKNLTSFK